MGQNNKPEDDAKAMREAYNVGTPIAEIAAKYGHTPYEVEQVVVTPVSDDEPAPKQDDKKGSK